MDIPLSASPVDPNSQTYSKKHCHSFLAQTNLLLHQIITVGKKKGKCASARTEYSTQVYFSIQIYSVLSFLNPPPVLVMVTTREAQKQNKPLLFYMPPVNSWRLKWKMSMHLIKINKVHNPLFRNTLVHDKHAATKVQHILLNNLFYKNINHTFLQLLYDLC